VSISIATERLNPTPTASPELEVPRQLWVKFAEVFLVLLRGVFELALSLLVSDGRRSPKFATDEVKIVRHKARRKTMFELGVLLGRN
jgi:hypothetical protein